jgi:N-formylglutamate amidohydrolase
MNAPVLPTAAAGSVADAAAFRATLPADPATPVVVSVPHAGIETAGFADPLASTLDVRCDADLYVDELYQGAPGGGPKGAFIRARLSRFVCDLNRDPDDVAPAAVPAHPAPRNTDGRGFIWMVTTTGAPAQRRALEIAEWTARRDIHAAYHGAIRGALDRARRKFGFAILVDGHSMPSVGREGHADPGKPRADIVPGNRMGATCSARLSAAVDEHFRSHGFSVAFNDPYRGGFITAHHGRPADGIHAIQIEMRRDLYMNEVTFERHPDRMSRLSQVLGELLRKLDDCDPR